MVNSIEPVGAAKSLILHEGDAVNIDAKYYFQSGSNGATPQPLANILLNLANVFMPGYSAGTLTGEQLAAANSTFIQNGQLNYFLTNALNNAGMNPNNSPQAFLTWLFFDNEFNFIPSASGVLQADQADQLHDLGVLNITAPDNGYMYVYVSNGSPRDVSFNNLRIGHIQGNLIEVNHYYPYGLLIEPLSWHSGDFIDNLYKYGDKELQSETNLEDFGARQYDMVLGRWHVQDPAGQYNNPYIAMGNCPVIGVDEDGEWFLIDDIVAAAVGGTMNLISSALDGKIHSLGEGLAYFGAGAAGGEATLYLGPVAGFAIGGSLNVAADIGFGYAEKNGKVNVLGEAISFVTGGLNAITGGQAGMLSHKLAVSSILKEAAPTAIDVTGVAADGVSTTLSEGAARAGQAGAGFVDILKASSSGATHYIDAAQGLSGGVEGPVMNIINERVAVNPLITPNGTIVTFAKAGLNKIISRKIGPEALKDAVKNPLTIKDVVYDNLGRPSQRYLGRYAEVVINPESGKIVSANPMSSKKLIRILKLLRK
jgi:RHS repeat-associated protein